MPLTKSKFFLRRRVLSFAAQRPSLNTEFVVSILVQIVNDQFVLRSIDVEYRGIADRLVMFPDFHLGAREINHVR